MGCCFSNFCLASAIFRCESLTRPCLQRAFNRTNLWKEGTDRGSKRHKSVHCCVTLFLHHKREPIATNPLYSVPASCLSLIPRFLCLSFLRPPSSPCFSVLCLSTLAVFPLHPPHSGLFFNASRPPLPSASQRLSQFKLPLCELLNHDLSVSVSFSLVIFLLACPCSCLPSWNRGHSRFEMGNDFKLYLHHIPIPSTVCSVHHDGRRTIVFM